MEVYDNCGHKNLAVQQLTQFLPVLSNGYAEEQCSQSPSLNGSTFIPPAGIIDMSGIDEDLNVAESIRDFYIPRIATGGDGILPAISLATDLIGAIKELKWTKMVVVNVDDEYSIRVVKAVGQLAARANICIGSVHVIPSISEYKPTSQNLKTIRGVINSQSARVFLNAVSEAFLVTEKFQWFFSSVINPLSVDTMPGLVRMLNANRVYSLAPFPAVVKDFEKYWTAFLEQGVLFDVIFYSFLENIVPSIHAILVYANALKSAWKESCQNKPGVCTKLAELSHKDFLEKYLQPLTFVHSTKNRSPPDIGGKKAVDTFPGQISEMKMALTLFKYSKNNGFTYDQVIALNEGKAELFDPKFSLNPSLCENGKCDKCVSVRQSRLLGTSEELHSWIYPTDHDVLIPVLLPIHEEGANPLECGKKINPIAIQTLEALIWTIDEINNKSNIIPGVKIGTIVLDTCSSTLKTAERISEVFNSEQKKEYIDSILAFITTTSEDHETAVSMLAPMNITTISIEEVHTLLGKDHFNYQIPVPVSVTAQAVVSLLNEHHWTFVSLITSPDDKYIDGADYFRQFAKQQGICIADDIVLPDSSVTGEFRLRTLDGIIRKLKSAKDRGATFIVQWTSISDTHDLLAATKRAVDVRFISVNELKWIGTDSWSNNLDVIKGFEEESKGVIIVAPTFSDTRDFVLHYTTMDFEAGTMNPWMENLFGQLIESCQAGNPDCQILTLQGAPALKYIKTPKVPNMIQAAWSIAAGLRRLRDVVCKEKVGLCSELYHAQDFKYLFNHYIQNAPAPTPDNNKNTFHFTQEGYGNSPVFTWNLKVISNRLKYHRTLSTDPGPLVVYDGLVESSANQVTSECRIKCKSCYSKPRHIFLESPDDLYLVAVFPIHDQDRRSLDCGQITTSYGIQNMEAFMWAIDIINKSFQLLSGIKLGAIGLDTCSSKEKTVRDVYNLFTNSEELGFKVEQHQIAGCPIVIHFFSFLGVVVGSTTEEVKSILSITEEVGITTISPDVTTMYPSTSKKLVTLSLPNKARAKALTRILQRFRWTFASVIYLSGNTIESDIYNHLVNESKHAGIMLGLQEGVTETPNGTEDMDNIVERLLMKKSEGSSAVILILPPKMFHQLLEAMLRLPKEKAIKPGDFVWIIMDDDAAIKDLPFFTLGSLIVRPNFGHIPQFTHYFQNLRVENNTRDTWFREYMQGPGKYTHGLLDHGESAVNTINAVYAMAQALDKVQKDLCPEGTRGPCNAMKTSHPALRSDIHKYILNARFRGSDLRDVFISADGQGSGELQILNYQKIGPDRASFVEVGEYNEGQGLKLNATRAYGYDSSLKTLKLSQFVSKCQSKACFDTRIPSQTSKLSMPAHFEIGALLSIHEHDKDFFKCGKFNANGAFQNLLAMTYAIKKINNNHTLLPAIELGTTILDYCDRPERAQQELFSYFAQGTNERPNNLIGAITFDSKVADTVSPILDANDIVQVVNPISTVVLQNVRSQSLLQLVPTINGALSSAVEILKLYDWSYVTLIHSDNPMGHQKANIFKQDANSHDICISKRLKTNKNMSEKGLKGLVKSLSSNKDSQVVILMVDTGDEARSILHEVQKERLSSTFTWIIIGSWANTNTLKGFGNLLEGSFVINMHSYHAPDFKDYYNGLTLENHSPIPDDWFEEFWQTTFMCHLPFSKSKRNNYSTDCTGSERLDRINFNQDDHVFLTIEIVNIFANTLDRFLERNCRWLKDFRNLKECGPGITEKLTEALQNAIKLKNQTDDIGYKVMSSVLDKTGRYQMNEIGKFENNKLRLNKNEIKLKKTINSKCTSFCNHCDEQLNENGYSSRLINQSLDQQFTTVWGLVATSISLLGILFVIICILYFLMAFPISTGTTVLGYMILVGIMLLYGTNFAFIVAATDTTCGLRRFLMGVAYTMIFSGMLIKAFNTWRLTGCHDPHDIKYKTKLTKPVGLMTMALGLVLIQIVLISAWMILMPPATELYQGNWYCSPAPKFEQQLIISLTYCGLLLLLTLLFSGLSWNCDENHRESRWIFVCCLLITITWAIWMILATNLPGAMRDPTIIISNIVCATIIMLLLYLRKVYLYSKYSKQVKDFELTTHLKTHPYSASAYGTCLRGNGIGAIPEFMRGSQVSLTSDFTFEAAPNSTLTELTSEGMSTRSSDSAGQVQGTDLYPMEVYDGGSQFQANNLSCNSRRALVFDELKNLGKIYTLLFYNLYINESKTLNKFILF
ncbi:Metabotropic glutamate receptor [Nymphon striatum]|nr:Metabotropic glutamate receptor [Nymphon striatum]